VTNNEHIALPQTKMHMPDSSSASPSSMFKIGGHFPQPIPQASVLFSAGKNLQVVEQEQEGDPWVQTKPRPKPNTAPGALG
jgi:hypothetical protein